MRETDMSGNQQRPGSRLSRPEVHVWRTSSPLPDVSEVEELSFTTLAEALVDDEKASNKSQAARKDPYAEAFILHLPYIAQGFEEQTWGNELIELLERRNVPDRVIRRLFSKFEQGCCYFIQPGDGFIGDDRPTTFADGEYRYQFVTWTQMLTHQYSPNAVKNLPTLHDNWGLFSLNSHERGQFHILSSSRRQNIMLASQQMVLSLQSLSWLVIVLLDPWKGQHFSTRALEPAMLARLVSVVREQISRHPSKLLTVAIESLFTLILGEDLMVLKEIDQAIWEIDRSMECNDKAREAIQYWRRNMGCWRAHLHWLQGSLTEVSSALKSVQSLSPIASDLRSFSHGNEPICQGRNSQTCYQELRLKHETTLAHCESTFTALMATMSIIESEKAINEAEEVTKLTHLAFIFIPLTYVASIFGMNLAVSECYEAEVRARV